MGLVGLRIDFAAPSAATRRRTAVIAAIGVSIVIFALAALLGRNETPPMPTAPEPVVATPSPAVDATRLRRQRVRDEVTLPWGNLFGALERAATKEVALVSFEASADDGTVALEADSADVAAMAGYLKQLSQARLQDPTVVRQQPSAGSDRVRFSAVARWVPAQPHQRADERGGFVQLPTGADVGALSAEWLAIAKSLGLTVRGVEHEWSAREDSNRFATLAFDISGDYGAAREFVNNAVGSGPGIALRQFSLRTTTGPGADASAGGSTTLQGRVVLRIFVRETE